MRNTFAKNMSTDMKLSKSRLGKIIQSVGLLGKTLGNLDKNVLLDLAVPLVKEVLAKSATKETSSVLDKFERKISGKGAVGAGRELTLFISIEETFSSTLLLRLLSISITKLALMAFTQETICENKRWSIYHKTR